MGKGAVARVDPPRLSLPGTGRAGLDSKPELSRCYPQSLWEDRMSLSQLRLQAVVAPRPTPPVSGEDQVFAALIGLGGAAHLDEIVERVALERRRRGLTGGPPVRMIVESALHHMRAPDDRPQGEAGARVYRPFGAASRRWAVCRDHAVATVHRPHLTLLER